MVRNHDVRLLQLLKQALTVEEAMIVVAYEAGINAGAGWSLLSIKRLEFMAPIVRARIDPALDLTPDPPEGA